MKNLTKYLVVLAMLFTTLGYSQDRIDPGSRPRAELQERIDPGSRPRTDVEKEHLYFNDISNRENSYLNNKEHPYLQEEKKLDCPCNKGKKSFFQKEKLGYFEGEKKLDCPCNKRKKNLTLENKLPPLIFDNFTHNLVAISAIGDYIVIEDGSQWKINPDYLREVLTWKENNPIILCKNDSFYASWFSDFSYKMYNVNKGTYVEVNLDLGPFRDNPNSLQIVAINHGNSEVILSDSSRWQLDPSKAHLLKDWDTKDGIILGKPSPSWFSSKYDTFLLNVNIVEEINAKRIQ